MNKTRNLLVGYQQIGMKKKNGKMVPNCVKENVELYYEENGKGYGYTFEFITDKSLQEAEYQGRKVKLNKIMQGDAKKFKVYVKNPKGNVVKVNFGQGGDAKGGTMRIRKSNPKARANFRARHNCDNPGPKHKARDIKLVELGRRVMKSKLTEWLVKPYLNESPDLDIKVGDDILMGRFKNKRVKVKSITYNEKGDLLINGRPALKFRKVKNDKKLLPSKTTNKPSAEPDSDRKGVDDEYPFHKTEAKRIPRKKGQHRGSKSSHSDLYTDENPKGTIHGLKLNTRR